MLFAVPVILTGCGQKQELETKPAVAAPVSAVAEDVDDAEEEAEDMEEAAPAASDVQKAVVETPSSIEEPPAPIVEAPKTQAPSEELVIADFNSGDKPNNLGSNFGAWNKDPSDMTQWCKESFDNVTRHGDAGFSMKLDYSVASPNPAYNGFWMMLPNFDASKYDDLRFWVKGDAKEGYTTVFKVELKNAAKQMGRFYISNVSDQWQEIVIPLSEFKGLPDKANLTELVIVFEDRMASNKKGIIYVDDFRFTKK